MTFDPYKGVSNPSPRQVSTRPDPDAAAWHRSFFGGVLVAISVLAFVGGLRTAFRDPELSWRVSGAVAAAAGAPFTFLAARKLWMRIAQTRRLRADRCVHCGYSLKGLRSGVCPECGRDPFDDV